LAGSFVLEQQVMGKQGTLKIEYIGEHAVEIHYSFCPVHLGESREALLWQTSLTMSAHVQSNPTRSREPWT
jgi:hypothetical protein